MTTQLIIASGTLAVAAGSLAALGLVLAVAGAWPRPPRLADVFARLDGQTSGPSDAPGGAPLIGDPDSRAERLSAWAYQHWRLPLGEQTRRRLAQQRRSIGDLFAAKLTLAAAGLFMPTLVVGIAWLMGVTSNPWPFGLALIGGALGYMWPDWQLRGTATAWQQHSADAISMYFDLVTLIRLGNASAVQSLREAAELSQAPVFVQVRDALDRARLQQRSPWAELHELSVTLGLPEVADLADIMALDEQGAALVEPLRARVKELRKAHLAAANLVAQKKAEGMTVWMVVPVLVFALIFLVPPLMTMMASLS